MNAFSSQVSALKTYEHPRECDSQKHSSFADFEPGNLTRANDALNYLTRMVIEKQNKYERDDISRVHLPTKTADYEEGESTAYEEETITHIDIAQGMNIIMQVCSGIKHLT